MKKVLIILASFILSATVFAEQQTWTNFLGFGARLPLDIKYEIEDSEGTFKNVGGLNISYMGAHQNGFSVKGSCNIDASEYKTIDLIGCEYLIGFGYSNIVDDKWFLGVYGTFGQTLFFGSSKGVNFTFSNLSLGIDVTGVYTISTSFSIYGSIGMNFLLPGTLEAVQGNASQKTDTDATYSFVPVIGVCWKF